MAFSDVPASSRREALARLKAVGEAGLQVAERFRNFGESSAAIRVRALRFHGRGGADSSEERKAGLSVGQGRGRKTMAAASREVLLAERLPTFRSVGGLSRW